MQKLDAEVEAAAAAGGGSNPNTLAVAGTNANVAALERAKALFETQDHEVRLLEMELCLLNQKKLAIKMQKTEGAT